MKPSLSSHAFLSRLTLGVALLISLLGFLYQGNQRSLSHVMMSNLLPVIASQHNLGVPYRDYWDIYPPGIYVLLTLLYWLGLASLPAFKVLHLLMTVGLCLFSGWVATKIFGRNTLTLSPVLCAIFLASPAINMLFSNTLLCMSISSVGLVILIEGLNHKSLGIPAHFVSLFLITVAGTAKDTFLPPAGMLALVIFVACWQRKASWPHFAAALAGMLFALGLAYYYLNAVGAVTDFVHVSATKSELYGGAAWIRLLPYSWIKTSLFRGMRNLIGEKVWLVAVLACVFVVMQAPEFSPGRLAANINSKESLFAAWVSGHLAGFAAQGKLEVGYALVQLVPLLIPMAYLVLCKSMMALPNVRLPVKVRMAALVAFVTLLPRIDIIRDLPEQIGSAAVAFSWDNLAHDERFGGDLRPEMLPRDVYDTLIRHRSIFIAYGWGAPLEYYRFGIQPSMRFFIPNARILGARQRQEWRERLAQSPPAVVRYYGENADMDVEGFEKSVFPLKELLNKCYKSYEQSWYVLKEGCRLVG